MFPNKLLNFIILVFLLILTAIFSGCGGITTPGISQDTLSAVITANPTSGEAPLEVTFNASESSAAQGNEIVSYEWDFGDGKTGEGRTVHHGFDSPGNYTVILTISDNKGAVDTSSVIIKVFQSTETVIEQSFDLQNGTEFDTGTGLKVSVSPVSTVGKAKLIVAENYSPQQLGEGLIKLLSVYSISLVQESISQGQKMDKESSEGSLNVELMFDIPSGTDPNSVVILEWTDEGWVLASSSDSPDSIDSLGGVLTPDKHSIFIELQHLSTYALSRIEFNWGTPVIFPQVSEPSITTEGDINIDVLLESPHWGIISAGAWYQIEIVNELGCKSIKSTSDLSFGDWGENKGFLGPKENKKLQFTFWGTGGTAPIFLSVRDGWPMALRDYLVRLVGKNLDWPYTSREAMEKDFIKKCGIGIASTVFSESVNKLGDELIKVTSIQDGIRSLWKWMRKYGIGNWISFIATSKLAVDTVGHVILNQGGYINYSLIGGILPPLVKVNPAEVVINAGESVQFSASLVTFDGNQVLSTNPSSTWGWDVSGGGSIDENGLFVANNNTSGTYTIKARTGYFGIDGEVHKAEGEANVIINATGSTTTPLDPPTPLSPGTTSSPGPTIDSLTPTLQWQTVSNADYYNLAISEYPYGTTNIVYNPQQISGSSITVPSGKLQAVKKYRWNMRAYNSAGFSEYSITLYFQTGSTTTKKPDLIVSNVWTEPNPPIAAGYTTIGIEIKNQGNADATGTFFLEFYFDGTYQGHVYINGLTAGSTNTSYWQAVTWPSDTNLHTIKGVVDPDNIINESNESNNQYSIQVKATEPPIGTGTLKIESVPGSAKVYIDGVYKGVTPSSGYLTISNLAAGDHNLKVTKSGYKDWIGVVTIPSGSIKYKAVILESTTTPLLPPTPLSPGSSSAPGPTIDTLTPTLQWQEVDNVDYYALAISIYPYGSSNIVYNPQKVYGSSITVPSGVLEAGKKYRWNMQSYNSAGWSDDVSDLLYFQTAPPPSSQIERITNGSFSSGTSGWTLVGDFWAGTNFSNYRTPPGYAAGGVNSEGLPINNAAGWMYQTVTIPSGATSATLSFWYNITSYNPGPNKVDFLTVYVSDSGGNWLDWIIYSNLDRTYLGDYKKKTFDLTAHKGKTVTIKFLATSDYSNTTTFRIDDVSLMSDG